MKPNPYLSNYTSEEVNSLIQTGSITPMTDGMGNVLISDSQQSITGSCITIPLTHILFDPAKVELQYDVEIKEIS